jgi:hypothetical protein
MPIICPQVLEDMEVKMIIPSDNEIKEFIRSSIKSNRLSVAQLERLSGFYGLRLYLNEPGRSASVKNVLAVLLVLNDNLDKE